MILFEIDKTSYDWKLTMRSITIVINLVPNTSIMLWHQKLSLSLKFWKFKGIVSLISSDPACEDGNALFMTYPWNLNLIRLEVTFAEKSQMKLKSLLKKDIDFKFILD